MPNYRSTGTKFTDAVVRFCAISLAFLAPLFVLPVAWASVSQGKALAAALLLVTALIAWLIGSVSSRRIAFPVDPIIVAALLLPVAYALSAYVSGAPASSFASGDAVQGTVAAMLVLFGTALIGAFAVQEKRIAFPITIAFLISGTVVLLLHVLRIFFPAEFSLFGALAGSTSSVLGSWHDLGIFSGLLLIVSCGLIETSVAGHPVYRVLLQVLAVLSFGMLMVINFADVWYAVAGAALLFAFSRALRSYRRQGNFARSLRAAVFWLVLIFAGTLAGWYGPFINAHLPTPLKITQIEVRPSWSGTLTAGQKLFEGGKALVFGSGPNTFDRQWALFKPTEVNATNFWNTDFSNGYGVVPTALITVGIVGIACWVLLTLSLLWTGWRTLSDENEGRLRVILSIASAFLLFFHIVYVPSLAVSLIAFLMLGVLAGLNTSSWRVGSLTLVPRSIFAFVAVLVVSCSVIGAALVESRVVVSTLFTSRAAALYQESGDLSGAAMLVSRAVLVDPQNDIAQRAAVQIGLLQFGELAKNNATDDVTREQLQKTLSSTIAHGLAAVSIDESNYQNWLALAGLYQSFAGVGIQGAYEQAQTAWLRAASTTPANPIPLMQLGQLAKTQGENDTAAMYYTKAIALKPDLAPAYYLRSQIRASKADWKGATDDAAAAAQLVNTDPLGWYNFGAILYASGDSQNATLALEKAVSLQNDYSDAIFALAVVYDKLGQRENALAAAQKVAELNPGDDTVSKVLQNITAGQGALAGL
jgi:tetratricopeptide (TPR) repeat protein